MPTPSLLIVPARFKSGKLYSQLPTSGAGDFTVTRATAATRVNASGLIESVASGIPRLDYFASGGTVGCPALLVEPSAQNLCLQSENFGTTWSPNQLIAFGSGSVLNTTGTLDPYGTNVSDLIVASTVSGVQHRIDQTTTSASGSYTFSVFVKAAGYNFTWLRIGTVGAFFNLSNGAITGTSAGIVASSQNYGNGWYRCIISKASSSANEVLRINIIQTDGVTDFAGDGTSGIYVFGAQYETGTVATSYIPTTTGSITRNADVVSVSGAVSGSIGQTEGTLYAEIVAQPYNNASFPAILQVDDGADSQRFAIFINPSGGIRVRFNASGVNTNLDSATPSVLVAGQTYKIAAAFNFNGSQALYINGVFQASGTVTAGPFTATLNRVMLGHRGGIVSPFLIRSSALYTTRLTNDQLAALTTP